MASHWEALNLVKRTQNQCDADLECQDMPAVWGRTIQIAPLPIDVIYTSPHLIKIYLRRCCCLTFSWILAPNLVTWNLEEEEYNFLEEEYKFHWIFPISSGTPLYEEGMTFSNHNVRGLVKRTDVILPQCYNENAHRVPLQTCKRHKPTAWKNSTKKTTN